MIVDILFFPLMISQMMFSNTKEKSRVKKFVLIIDDVDRTMGYEQL